MTAARTYLAGIKERVEGATEGPWELDEDGGINDADFCSVVGTVWPHGSPTRQLKLDAHNAEFIAHSRTDLPRVADALLAVLKVVDEKYRIWAAICGNTCSKEIHGVDHDAIADEVANVIHTVITEALEASL